ncbi:alternative ribosome rescue aminoacyl-tRNA hydrolase ArfB [Microbulbifer sp. 2205BS26-8]|uniref:alternative ribosome rescue aminoacyl-tRNA hydrolase ArfB n=1 Tax=Microbulbifer sp. 2205BS26-8 TaxID=3064386 RepID=UPI00273D30B8|nr:alternative ribosome rescue aminoacyl-tRNA hydrolase ArfB [Microbulbifer sp. 2205BS26-8]MDP5211229.1 alternative ribosome rescue aminoacyl-tRNA hydrolase ArfB [Microbulbifer sp. 2205BS26-8]
MRNDSRNIKVPVEEIQIRAMRARGAGGQNVNKVSTAIHLRFDILASSLPEEIKQRLLQLRDRRISGEGVVVIRAQRFRTQEKNRADALERLQCLIEKVLSVPRRRVATKPSRGARERRLECKSRRSKLKVTRGKIRDL